MTQRGFHDNQMLRHGGIGSNSMFMPSNQYPLIPLLSVINSYDCSSMFFRTLNVIENLCE